MATDKENPANDDRQFARVRISRGSCYGSPALEITFDFGASGEKVAARFSEGSKNKTVSLDLREVKEFLAKISAVVEKPEVLSGMRRAEISYHAEIEWKNLEFIEGGNSGEFKAFSNEWLVDEIAEFIEYEAATPEIAERLRKILDAEPHRHALEIYDAVKRFFRKHLM